MPVTYLYNSKVLQYISKLNQNWNSCLLKKSLFIFLLLLSASWGVNSFPHASLGVIPVAIIFNLWRAKGEKIFVFQTLAPLFILFGIVLLSTFLWGFERPRYEIFRDFYYFGKPVLFIYAGMVLFYLLDHDYSKCLKIIAIVIAVQIALQFLFVRISGISLGLVNRQEGGFIGIESNILFLITAVARRCRFALFSSRKLLSLELLALTGIAFSFGRTFYVFTALAWLLIYFDRKRVYQWIGILMSVFAMLTIFHGELLLDYFHADVEDYSTLSNKLRNSFNELLVFERTDMTSINREWRGFEAYLGLQMFFEGNIIQQLAGQGAGAICRNDIFLDERLSALPIFHNGYVTILLKAGYLGLFFFFLFICSLFNTGTPSGQSGRYITSLLALLGINLLFNTQVIHGIFTNETPMFLLLLVGVSLACRNDITSTVVSSEHIHRECSC